MFGRCQHLKEDRTLELTRVPVELLLHGHKVLMNSTPRCSIFMWRKTRINYTFIFELAPTKDLWYRDVFLICTTSMTAVMGVLFVHLSLVAKGYSYSQVQAIPAVLLLVPMLRNLEYVACYYITGSFKTQNYRYCMMTKNYRDLAYAVSYLPYYWRAMQCARRWFGIYPWILYWVLGQTTSFPPFPVHVKVFRVRTFHLYVIFWRLSLGHSD